MLADIARAGPFGAGHAEPVFALPSHTIAYAEEVGQAHVRARLRSGDGAMLNAIAFRAAGKPLGHALIANRGRNVHAAGTLSIDRWNGEERVQFRLMDVASDGAGGVRQTAVPSSRGLRPLRSRTSERWRTG